MGYRETMQKKVSGGGSKKDYDGMSYPRNTRAASGGKLESRWEGKVRGKMKHTYGVDGEGDSD